MVFTKVHSLEILLWLCVSFAPAIQDFPYYATEFHYPAPYEPRADDALNTLSLAKDKRVRRRRHPAVIYRCISAFSISTFLLNGPFATHPERRLAKMLPSKNTHCWPQPFARRWNSNARA